MSYNYETLDPETFQKLAQAMLVAAHPGLVCFPVGQPDGGRDAVLYLEGLSSKKFVVFQIKFSRSPSDKAERDAIDGVIKSEHAKVRDLITRGASHYYLITNVKGSAHLGVGSVDQAHSKLTAAFSIPSYVWWRDDLDARLDNLTDIKWSYPQICSAVDVLSYLVRAAENPSISATARVFNAYMAHQYSLESEVKFKQVELKRALIKLFVDLPLRIQQRHLRGVRGDAAKPRNDLEEVAQQLHTTVVLREDLDDFSHEEAEGHAALFLLRFRTKSRMAKFVIEGAPGQGKSTVSQYICQVNRIRLLKKFELKDVAADHLDSQVRVPFRIDLRDFAAWISGRHPFARPDEPAQEIPARRTLETFIAMQVSWQSSLGTVTADALLEFLGRSHSLIVLDGFDEVADISIRAAVVNEICQSTVRLEANVLSVVMVVTSRPAAFANSPGFPDEDWLHLSLGNLRRGHIDDYTGKWLAAQDLNAVESKLIIQTLQDKLEQPHLRELARNPMQLAILLHLIHIQGAALPDKRTALYDKYMELFFNREAEKSTLVRDYRDLLFAIHGFLAWVLHCQAESGTGSGSVAKAKFKVLVQGYLHTEGYDTQLADKLLVGIEERVVAIVARIEGMYEFEVQPIREYFAARYLYKTAPYSPVGKYRSGTRPERFDALARNLYWSNVTRFFCGFYDRGELGSLVNGLIALGEQAEFSLVNHPRRLAMLLLGDWVFAESPRDLKRLLGWIAEEPSFSRLMADTTLDKIVTDISLPIMSGRADLKCICVEKLVGETYPRLKRSLRAIVAANSDPLELKAEWLASKPASLSSNAAMLVAFEYGIKNLSSSEVSGLASGSANVQSRWLARLRRLPEVYKSELLLKAAFDDVVSGNGAVYSQLKLGDDLTGIEVLAHILIPVQFTLLFSSKDADPIRQVLFPIIAGGHLKKYHKYEHPKKVKEKSLSSRIDDYASFAVGLMFQKASTWRSHFGPWEELVNRGFDEAPGAIVFSKFALLSSAFQSRKVRGIWSAEGWSLTAGLCARLRFARLKTSDITWWSSELDKALPVEERLLLLASVISWGLRALLRNLRDKVSVSLDNLQHDEWRELVVLCELLNATGLTYFKASEGGALSIAVDGSKRFAFVIMGREKNESRIREGFRSLFSDATAIDQVMVGKLARVEFLRGTEQGCDWGHILRLSSVARGYGLDLPFMFRGRTRLAVPEEIARCILDSSEDHSLSLILAAEQSYSACLARRAPKVEEVAKSEKWF